MESPAAAQPPSTWELLRTLGTLIPFTVLTSLAIGIFLPASSFVGINFFAQRHTDLRPSEIACQKSMLLPHCQEAVIDTTELALATAVAVPFVQLLVLPLIGAASDYWGRRRLLIGVHLLNILNLLLVGCFQLFNTSLYWHLALNAIISNPITTVAISTILCYTIIIDLIEHKPSRSVGMGLLEAVAAIATCVGNGVGSFMSLNVALLVSCGLSALAGLELLVFLPESLPPSKRKQNFSWSSLLPGLELRILWRTPLLLRLTLIILFTGFTDKGFSRIFPLALMRMMEWTQRDSYLLSLVGSSSTIVCLGLFFRPMATVFGNVGMLAIGRWFSLTGLSAALFVGRPWQVLLLSTLTMGPEAFSVPAIAGLQSSLVHADEQGSLQASLNTAYSFACAIGVLLFGVLFDVTNRSVSAGVDKTAFGLLVASCGPVLLLIHSMSSQTKDRDAHILGSPEVQNEPVVPKDAYGSTA